LRLDRPAEQAARHRVADRFEFAHNRPPRDLLPRDATTC
jgi:hypothetical protein